MYEYRTIKASDFDLHSPYGSDACQKFMDRYSINGSFEAVNVCCSGDERLLYYAKLAAADFCKRFDDSDCFESHDTWPRIFEISKDGRVIGAYGLDREDSMIEVSNDLPKDFNIDVVERVLRGGRLMIGAFRWGSTPQGFSFWADEVRSLVKTGVLSDTARLALEGWVSEYKRRNKDGDNLPVARDSSRKEVKIFDNDLKFLEAIKLGSLGLSDKLINSEYGNRDNVKSFKKEDKMRSNSLPGRFNVEGAKQALSGNADALMDTAFNWNSTLQGRAFWGREYHSLLKGDLLSEEARAAIEGWIEVWNESNKEDKMNNKFWGGFDVEDAKQALAGNAYALISSAFVWRYSPQGYEFWEAEHSRLRRKEPLSRGAKEALEGWISEYESRQEKESVCDRELRTARDSSGNLVNLSGKWISEYESRQGEKTKASEEPQKKEDKKTEKEYEYTFTAEFAFSREGSKSGVIDSTLLIPDPPESEGWEKGETEDLSWPMASLDGVGKGYFRLFGNISDAEITHENGLIWWHDHKDNIFENALCVSVTSWLRECPEKKEETCGSSPKEVAGPTWWPPRGRVEGPIK